MLCLDPGSYILFSEGLLDLKGLRHFLTRLMPHLNKHTAGVFIAYLHVRLMTRTE